MSTAVSAAVHCDGCGDLMSVGDHGSTTPTEARAEAKRLDPDAIVRAKGGKDWCGDCVEDGRHRE